MAIELVSQYGDDITIKHFLGYALEEGGKWEMMGYWTADEADEAFKEFKEHQRLVNPRYGFTASSEKYLYPLAVMRMNVTEAHHVIPPREYKA